MLYSQDMLDLARDFLGAMRAKGWKFASAESCTGGLIAGLLTEIAGSSDVVDRGFVTYSNEAKTALVNVPADMIASYGAVSEEVVRAMAEGALRNSLADITVAVSGVAGPGGGTAEKPVGRVHIAASSKTNRLHKRMDYGDLGRAEIRRRTVIDALALAQELLRE
jgi:nicotinamide-nucleotide amidase